ncbi:esterase-like activity of phytase family protein [Citricoccus sp. I39-566]|uniref:esterase-like activity of phytase family protein n=1 Tax=Citricoccus sp. I39-566 TaxID=3073268 RepID=UPI00286A6A82|nr:esterase-like activity of phytase family protein [Citricoccus sp. I39-566]WMY78213.1 esterase-like activity of phytase family protein [Citricoccus sp. I39-566]
MSTHRRLSGAVALGLSTALTGAFAAPVLAVPAVPAAPAVPAGEAADGQAFHRLATLPAYENQLAADEEADRSAATVAEISTVTADGNTVIHTDAEAGGIGFVDITDPENPAADGFKPTDGSPTSVYATEAFIIVVTDQTEDFEHPVGKVEFWDPETRELIHGVELKGQPDSIDVSPDGSTALIAMENQRDEDREDVDGGLPQLPAGELAVIDLSGEDITSLDADAILYTDLTGLDGLDTPQDPEPEYVKFSPDGTRAALTLQENNGVVVFDAEGTVLDHFSAGAVSVDGIDATEDGNLSLTDSITDTVREPDAIGWIGNDHVATANEGDWKGGSRGWTVFNADPGSEDFGSVVWDAGNTFENLAHRYGQFPEHRSENKGSEPEGLTVETYGDTTYAFVGSERGNFVAVYNVNDPANPVFTQLMPSTNGPEGLLAIPERNLMIVSSEEDDAEVGVRATVQVYRLGEGPAAVPTLKSADADGAPAGQPITWSALGALSAVPGEADQLYAAPDNFLSPSRIYTVDTTTGNDGGPATITSELTLEKGYDVEGLWADADGTFWLAVEGTAITDGEVGSEGNRLVHVDAEGQELASIDLPAEIAAGLRGQGLEGVTGYGSGEDVVLYAALQREAAGEDFARIAKFTPAAQDGAGAWEWFGYELEPTDVEGDWIGLSEITAVDEDSLALIERDKLNGPDAALKKVFTVDVPASGAATDAPAEEVEVLEKTEAIDVLPELRTLNGWTQEKLEGLAIAGNGNVYAVTDNDGVEDATGETVFLNLGAAADVFADSGQPGGPEPVEDFADNQPGSVYYAPVRWMQSAGVTTGYADGTYRKGSEITRGESVAFLQRYLAPGYSADPAVAVFPDVPVGAPHFTPIAWAADEANQVTTGYADDTFRPGHDVTRSEFVTFLYRAAGPEDYTAPAESAFEDVPATGTHYEAISWAASEGLVNGYTDGLYKPYDPINRGEVAKVMYQYDLTTTD